MPNMETKLKFLFIWFALMVTGFQTIFGNNENKYNQPCVKTTNQNSEPSKYCEGYIGWKAQCVSVKHQGAYCLNLCTNSNEDCTPNKQCSNAKVPEFQPDLNDEQKWCQFRKCNNRDDCGDSYPCQNGTCGLMDRFH